MPKFATAPDKYGRKFRHVTLYSIYFNMLYEICNEYLGIENIAQCMYFIIKDLYDSLTMSRSAEEKTRTQPPKKKRSGGEEPSTYIKPPPPP